MQRGVGFAVFAGGWLFDFYRGRFSKNPSRILPNKGGAYCRALDEGEGLGLILDVPGSDGIEDGFGGCFLGLDGAGVAAQHAESMRIGIGDNGFAIPGGPLDGFAIGVDAQTVEMGKFNGIDAVAPWVEHIAKTGFPRVEGVRSDGKDRGAMAVAQFPEIFKRKLTMEFTGRSVEDDDFFSGNKSFHARDEADVLRARILLSVAVDEGISMWGDGEDINALFFRFVDELTRGIVKDIDRVARAMVV